MDLLPPPPLALPATTTVSVTGHRPGDRAGGGYGLLRDGAWGWVRQVLPGVLDELGCTTLWSGAALGFDMLAALIAASTGRQMHLAIPFDGHHARWRADDVRRLTYLRGLAAGEHVVCEPGYAAWKLHARNDFLIAQAQVIVAFWDGRDGGGTASAVAKALKAGRPTLVLDPHARTLRWL